MRRDRQDVSVLIGSSLSLRPINPAGFA